MSTALTPDIARQKVGLEELRQLMRSVNDTTQQLEHTHAALREQVARLQGELAEANAQLRRSRRQPTLNSPTAWTEDRWPPAAGHGRRTLSTTRSA